MLRYAYMNSFYQTGLRNLLDRASDELTLRRLKKRRLVLRDQIARLESEIDPPEPA